MRFVLPILLAGSLLSVPALAQTGGQSTPAAPNSGADTAVKPTSPNASMGTSSMGSPATGSSSTGSSMAVGAPTGASMAPNPTNCGTPDEPKPCTDAGAHARPAAAHP